MAKQVNRAMIGGFVLIAVGIMAASILIFGSGDLFKKSLQYVLYFQESVKGLSVGTPVLYRGYPVGEVKRVLIRADMNTPFKYVQKVMFYCAQPNTQIWKIQLAAKETEEAKALRKAAEGN